MDRKHIGKKKKERKESKKDGKKRKEARQTERLKVLSQPFIQYGTPDGLVQDAD